MARAGSAGALRPTASEQRKLNQRSAGWRVLGLPWPHPDMRRWVPGPHRPRAGGIRRAPRCSRVTRSRRCGIGPTGCSPCPMCLACSGWPVSRCSVAAARSTPRLARRARVSPIGPHRLVGRQVGPVAEPVQLAGCVVGPGVDWLYTLSTLLAFGVREILLWWVGRADRG